MRILLAAAALLLGAAQAEAQPQTIELTPGDAATARLDALGRVAVTPEPGQAQWTPYELATARHLSGAPVPEQPEPHARDLPADGSIPSAPPIEAETVRFKFHSIAGRHSLLVIANGYARALVYRARMTESDRTRPTDVCLVVPGNYGFEHWPHPIDRLEIYDLRLVEWKDGDPPPCA
jgi:hypothetical protein